MQTEGLLWGSQDLATDPYHEPVHNVTLRYVLFNIILQYIQFLSSSLLLHMSTWVSFLLHALSISPPFFENVN